MTSARRPGVHPDAGGWIGTAPVAEPARLRISPPTIAAPACGCAPSADPPLAAEFRAVLGPDLTVLPAEREPRHVDEHMVPDGDADASDTWWRVPGDWWYVTRNNWRVHIAVGPSAERTRTARVVGAPSSELGRLRAQKAALEAELRRVRDGVV